MRRLSLFLVLLAGIIVLPNLTWSQGFGKKDGSGGMGGFKMPTADEAFDKLSGGKNEFSVSQLDENGKRRWQFSSTWLGLTGDRITRDQFKAAFEKSMGQFKIGGAQGSGSTSTTPQGTGSNSGSTAPMGNAGSTTSQSKEERKDRGSDSDARAEEFFKRSDRDNDGFLKFEEMSETLQRERDTYDTNKDGFVDLAEYKAYINARFAKKDNPPSDKEKPASTDEKKPAENNAPVVTDNHQPYKEDPRPQVFRAGKLPTKELPDWFVRLDKEGDSDGQVGLYEWKTLGKGIEEFSTMDLNADGLLTAEEYLRWKSGTKKMEGPDQIAKSEGTGTSQDRNSGRNGGGQSSNGGQQGSDGSRGFGRPGGDNGSNRFGQPGGSGFGPPMGGDASGANRGGFGGPKGGGFGGKGTGDSGSNGGNRGAFGGLKGGGDTSNAGENRGAFGGLKGFGGDASNAGGNNPLGNMFRKK